MHRKVKINSQLFVAFLFLFLVFITITGLFIRFNTPTVETTSQYYFRYDTIPGSDITAEQLVSDSLTQDELSSYYQVQTTTIFIKAAIVSFLITASVAFGLFFAFDISVKNSLSNSIRRILNNEKDNSLFGEELEVIDQELNRLGSYNDVLDQKSEILRSYVTHEQKNSLAVIRAGIELDIMGKEELLDEIDKINDSFDDILTLATVNSQVEKSEIDALLIGAHIVDKYCKIYPNIELVFEDEDDYTIYSKYFLIQRAIINLLENSIKYRATDDDLIQLIFERTNTSIVIRVADQGIGLSTQDLDEIFNFSYRVSNLKSNGYGVGLSLVKTVAEVSEGLVYAELNEDKGMTISLVFPLVN